MCWVGEEREGEVERLGVRRQETREQGSPSEWKKDKKEREGKNPTLPSQRRVGKEWGGLYCGVKQYTEIVGVSKTMKMYLKFDQQKSSRKESVFDFALGKKSLVLK